MQPISLQRPLSGPHDEDAARHAGSRLWAFILRHPSLSIFAIALVVRIVAGAVIHLVIGAAFFGVGDDTTYSKMAADVAAGTTQHWDGQTQLLYDITATFTRPLTLIYILFGPISVGGPFLAAVFGAATAALVTRLAGEALPVRWALAAGLATAFLPSQVLWSSMTLKDSAVWAMLAATGVFVAIANRATGRTLVLSGAGAATSLLLLGHLRMHTLVVAAVSLALAAFVSSRSQRVPRIVGAVLLAVVIPWVLGLGPAGISLVTSAGGELDSRRVANAAGAATALVADGTGTETESGAPAPPLEPAPAAPAAPGVPADDVGNASISHLPRGVSAMLLEPYPWRSTANSRVEIARLEAFLWYPLVLLALIGALGLRQAGGVLVYPVVVGGGILLMYALAEGNFGTAYRHRGEFVWVVILLATFGAQRLTAWSRRSGENS